MLSSGSTGSLRLARAVQKQVVSLLRVQDRGVIVRGPQDRGGESLFAGRAPAILTEPFFGSNREDLARVTGAEDDLADAYLRGAIGAFG
jgi:N-acetylmuramoyl-L-alanine amidase